MHPAQRHAATQPETCLPAFVVVVMSVVVVGPVRRPRPVVVRLPVPLVPMVSVVVPVSMPVVWAAPRRPALRLPRRALELCLHTCQRVHTLRCRGREGHYVKRTYRVVYVQQLTAYTYQAAKNILHYPGWTCSSSRYLQAPGRSRSQPP